MHLVRHTYIQPFFEREEKSRHNIDPSELFTVSGICCN